MKKQQIIDISSAKSLSKALDDLKDHIEVKRKHFLDFIRSTEIPLNLRWNLYLKYGKEFLPIDSYYFEPEGIDWNKHTLYHDFYCDKYATMTVDSMTEQIEQNEFEVDWIKYKESWLQKGIWGFIHDW